LKKEDKVPAIFFVFSKRKSRELVDHMVYNGPKLTTNDESQKIAKTIYNYKKSGKYLEGGY
jgi:superfamily II RNA helicase